MKKFFLKNPHNKEIIIVEAYNWEIQNYQHTFIGRGEDQTMIFSSYSTKNWDLIDVEI